MQQRLYCDRACRGTKLLNKVTACKVNSSSGAEQRALLTDAKQCEANLQRPRPPLLRLS